MSRVLEKSFPGDFEVTKPISNYKKTFSRNRFRTKCRVRGQQTRVYPYPLGMGRARPNPKMGAPDPENPLFVGFSVLGRGLRPWSQTMVSEGARPWGRGRSRDFQAGSENESQNKPSAEQLPIFKIIPGPLTTSAKHHRAILRNGRCESK